MSWTEIYPVFNDDLLETYQKEASEQEVAILKDWFEVDSIHNEKRVKHVVATSLFWKPVSPGSADYPAPSRDVMQNPGKHGLSSRFKNPWKHYVEPVFEAVRHLAEIRPDLVYRVYLANDMAFLIPDLVEAGCEVYLMKSSSVFHNPGAMWRFLAMEEEGLVTISDSDRAGEMLHDIERTELVAEGGLSHWRRPYMWGTTDCKDLGSPAGYHPWDAAVMGSAKPFPIRSLMEAFIWSCQKGLFKNECRLGDRRVPIPGSRWPEFGFDEWFLTAAFHPRAAFEGVMTFVNWRATELNQWFALDIEFTTWANPKSEIMFWGDPNEIPEGESRPGDQRP